MIVSEFVRPTYRATVAIAIRRRNLKLANAMPNRNVSQKLPSFTMASAKLTNPIALEQEMKDRLYIAVQQ